MHNQESNNQLYQNIKEARLQLQKLKQEAVIFENDPYNLGSHNMKEHMKNAIYSLVKNDQNVDRKIVEYKSKLPSIHKQQKMDVDMSILGGYKKYKKTYKHPVIKKPAEQSTKAQNSLSLSIHNRPAKIHSNIERTFKPEISHLEIVDTDLVIPNQLLRLKEEAEKLEKQGTSIRENIVSNYKRNFSSQKKKNQKYFDIRSEPMIKQPEDILKPPTHMEYSSIVDKYSKHQFMIINGKLISQGPQYASYSRIYQSIFGRIKDEVCKLEEMLRERKITFARLDGKKLAYLCLKEEIKKPELIDCLVDQTGKLKGILLPDSKYSGKKGKQLAAIKIQSTFKMHITREKYLILKKKSILIQRFFRRNLLRLKFQKQVHERNTKILQNFEQRQDELQQKWKEIRKKKRIQIHLNSIEVDEEKRLSIENFSERQNIQLSRIFRLKDDNVILIYVSSVDLSPELINYYYKMLQLANIPKYHDRLLFFTPTNASIFPKHFSVSKLLYYSSKTLKQLKIITQDLPTILFPGFPSNQLIKICEFLNCYLYSGSPQKIKPFTTRSQSLNFLKNLSLPCLPSAMEMYDYGQFLNTFSVLIIKNPEVKVWILKIDDEFGGRGIAYLDVSKSKTVQKLLNKIQYGNNTNDFFPTDPTDLISEPQNQQLTIKIRDFLKENLAQKLNIATPTVYRSYTQYMGRFIKKGGIIQAEPPLPNKLSLSYPSISFTVDPLGQFEIITTYQKIIGSPYRSYASKFPQKSLDIKEGINIIRKICESFKIRKIFGNFTIDFIVITDQGKDKQKITSRKDIQKNKESSRFWILDIDPFINNYTSSFYLFDVLMNGSFFPEKNIYLVEKDDEKSDSFSLDTMSTENQNSHNLVERSYIFVPHFFNQNMFKIKIKDFFKQARIERFNFDIGNKEGLCILLLDSLTSGTLSMISVSKSEPQSIHILKSMLEFIARMSDVKNVSYGKTDSEPSTDRILIKDILNLFLSKLRREDRAQSKVKAMKQYQNNRDLNFII